MKARGDIVRTLLHHLGVDFEDKQYEFGDETPGTCWEDCNTSLGMVFPNLPYWKTDAYTLSESPSVVRSICRKYAPDYMGRNEQEQAYADAFSSAIYSKFDLWFVPYMFEEDYAANRE